MSERIGDWLQTYSGKCFWPLDPRPEEVDIEDIAHALSLTCRYGGHCNEFYSVAEHSVLVSHFVDPQYALWGLLHDAAEAYSADIPRPLKRCLPDWAFMEKRIMDAVCERFGLEKEEPENVKFIDYSITTDEKELLMNASEQEWNGLLPALGATIFKLNPVDAKALFLNRFEQLSSR